MIQALLGFIPGLLKIGDKMIEDKDKRNEYAFKVLEMQNSMMEKVLEMKTYPFVDALVKLAMAGDTIIKGLFRPVASIVAMVFVAYCEVKGVQLSSMVEGVMLSLLPAWGVSRYKEKQAKTKEEESDLGW